MGFKTPKNSGYTLDQTILVVGIIAILIVLVIVSIGWTLLNRTSATKAVALLKQIESANSKFFGAHQMWPIEAGEAAYDTGSGSADFSSSGSEIEDAAISMLTSDSIVQSGTNAQNVDYILNNYENLLNGLREHADGYLLHDYGDGGRIQQLEMDLKTDSIGSFDTGKYYVIRLTNIPYSMAVEIDEKMDGKKGFDEGRLVVRDAGNGRLSTNCKDAPAAETTGYVNVCYIANSVH